MVPRNLYLNLESKFTKLGAFKGRGRIVVLCYRLLSCIKQVLYQTSPRVFDKIRFFTEDIPTNKFPIEVLEKKYTVCAEKNHFIYDNPLTKILWPFLITCKIYKVTFKIHESLCIQLSTIVFYGCLISLLSTVLELDIIFNFN